METTLRFPKSDNLQRGSGQQLDEYESLYDLLARRIPDLRTWLRGRGASSEAVIQEQDNFAYILSQFSSWRRDINAETEARMISKLGQLPSTGRCDAVGRILVELPNLSSEDVGNLPLIVRPAGKYGGGRTKSEANSTASGPSARTRHRSQCKASTETPSSSLAVPDVSLGVETGMNGTRYTIPSSSFSASMQFLHTHQTAESMDGLASKVHGLRLGPDTTCLELPILTVEYKKASDNLMKGTNQLRMYLAASVKFLQAIGITNVPVYGVQTDGPIVVLPAAVLRDDNVRTLSLFSGDVHFFDSSSTYSNDL